MTTTRRAKALRWEWCWDVPLHGADKRRASKQARRLEEREARVEVHDARLPDQDWPMVPRRWKGAP